MSHPIIDAILESDSNKTFEFESLSSSPVVPLQRAKEVLDFQNEKPVHRQICYLAAAGYRPAEIAELTNTGKGTVYALLRTPRARTFIADLIHSNFDDELQLLIRGGVVDAVMTLRELCVEGVNESTRVACARELLTQARNAPPQKTPVSILAEIEKIKDDNDDSVNGGFK